MAELFLPLATAAVWLADRRRTRMWFTETPWPPILICSVLAALLIAGWSANRRGSYLAGVLALVVLSGAIYVAELKIVTDAEQIEEAVYGITSAFQQGDVDKTLEYVSAKAHFWRESIPYASRLVKIDDDLRVTDVYVTMKANGSRGISHFRANATVDVGGAGNRGRQASRWEFTWQREADQWKVIHIYRLHVITGERFANPLGPGPE